MATKKKSKMKLALIAFLVFVLSTVVAGTLYIKFIKKRAPTQAVSEPTPKIDYSPPSEETTTESSKNKAEIIENMSQATQPQSTATPISVTITRASRSNVSVITEKIDNGTCTIRITQGGSEKITMQAKAIPDNTYSTCEGFSIDSTKLDSSPFSISVTVQSGSRNGSASQDGI